MDANAHLGKRGEGGVGSKDNEVLATYDQDTLDDNEGCLLTFAANHGLALVNTFFSTRKSGASRTFNGRGQGNDSTMFLQDSTIGNLSVTGKYTDSQFFSLFLTIASSPPMWDSLAASLTTAG